MRHLETGLQLASILCITNYFNFDDFNPDSSIHLVVLVVLLVPQVALGR